jgi:hypothetical protein
VLPVCAAGACRFLSCVAGLVPAVVVEQVAAPHVAGAYGPILELPVSSRFRIKDDGAQIVPNGIDLVRIDSMARMVCLVSCLEGARLSELDAPDTAVIGPYAECHDHQRTYSKHRSTPHRSASVSSEATTFGGMKLLLNWSALGSLLRTLAILGGSAFVGAIVLPVGIDGTLPLSWAAWKPILAVGLSAAVMAEFLWIRLHLKTLAVAAGLPVPGSSSTKVTTTVDSTPAAPVESKVETHGYSLLGVLGVLAIVGILALLVCHASSRAVVVDMSDAVNVDQSVEVLGSIRQENGVVAYVERTSSLEGEGCSGGVPTPQTQAVIDDSAALALCVEGVIQKDESAVPPAPATQVIVDEGVTCEPEAAALVAAIGQEVNSTNTAAAIAKVHADVSAKRAKKSGH